MRLEWLRRRWAPVGAVAVAVIGVAAWRWRSGTTELPPPSAVVAEVVWRVEPVPDAPHPHPTRVRILRALYADGFEAIDGRPVLAGDFHPPGHPAEPVLERIDALGCAGKSCLWMASDPFFGPPYHAGPHPADLVVTLMEPRGSTACMVMIRFTVDAGDRWTPWLVGRALVDHWREVERVAWLPVPEAMNWESSVVLSTTVPQLSCEDVLDRLLGADVPRDATR